jgi:4'-phosphopantetheinyl transferase
VTLSAPHEDEVHVWQASLDLDPTELDVVGRCLSPDERARAARFRLERDRARATASRAWLRHLLGGYLRERPAELEFVTDVRGKPRLVEPRAHGLRFSLSHSEGIALYAVTSGGEVGVDIERVQDDFPVAEMARRFFSASEQAAMAAVHADRRVRGHFECWTRKEAYLKGIGLGWSASSAPDAAISGWSVHSLDAGPDHVAAVAVAGWARTPDAPRPLRLSSVVPAPPLPCS